MTPVACKRSGSLVPATGHGMVPAVCYGLLLMALVSCAAHAQAPALKPQGYVNDFAGVLSDAARQRLTALATELDQKTKSQLAVVTVQTLNGQPIEDYSVALATRWGIGSKKAGDTGVMLLLAIADHKSRIEVGYGVEPILTDGQAGDILRSMVPDLRRGDFDAAVTLGAGQIAAIIAKANHVSLDGLGQLTPPRARQQDESGSNAGALATVLVFLGILILLMWLNRRSGGGWYGGSSSGMIIGGILGSMLGGSSGGRGGFSSGGFGGFGGGGFGGGGASGSW